jgi:hypothetical protein
MPSPKSKGYIHLNYPSHPPSASHFSLSLFRPAEFPLGVIGIASCSRTDSLSSILVEFNASLKEVFPKESVYPLARNCFIFEEDDGSTNLNLGDLLPGLVVIPSAMGNKKENIETLLADLCSNILGEFSTIVSLLSVVPRTASECTCRWRLLKRRWETSISMPVSSLDSLRRPTCHARWTMTPAVHYLRLIANPSSAPQELPADDNLSCRHALCQQAQG